MAPPKTVDEQLKDLRLWCILLSIACFLSLLGSGLAVYWSRSARTEGSHANRSGRALTAWARDNLIDWAKHTTWHDHQTESPTQTNARRDHIPPPPPPPPWGDGDGT